MLIPEAYGGFEVHPTQFLEVIEALSRADGSTGWCTMIGAGTAETAAWLSESAARTVYGAPESIVGGVAGPYGRAELVDGGYRVTGRWAWASGSAHSDWLGGGVVVTQGGQPRMVREGVPQTRLLFFRASDVTLHDTWFASGLCGTGSGDMEVKDLFVPAEHGFSFAEPPRIARPLYGFPFGLLGLGIPAVALGIARRSIDELKTLALQKLLMPGRRPLATRPSVQEAVADAEATWRSARAFLMEAAHSIFEASTRGEVSVAHRAELRLAMTHATRSAARVVDRMYDAAGGSSVSRSSPLQRCFRDIHVATQHAMVAPATLETFGSVLLGVETDTSRL
jgi:alkylation response protein AidB-like acyl-CoA dehydrogenase